ncbi:hypothetical protein BSKO_10834 [Bryopsis sp. KO-2023]|nr:hypothetical protein BSKO_10834 [Bryopsis sp. KO-2023]
MEGVESRGRECELAVASMDPQSFVSHALGDGGACAKERTSYVNKKCCGEVIEIVVVVRSTSFLEQRGLQHIVYAIKISSQRGWLVSLAPMESTLMITSKWFLNVGYPFMASQPVGKKAKILWMTYSRQF